MDWQPIETAPHNGRWVLLWERYSDAPFIGRFSDHDKAWTVSHEHVRAEGGWDGAIIEDAVDQKLITHWMPLPEAPEYQDEPL